MIKLGEVVMILDLHRQGLTVSAIARELGVDRKTVRRCIARGLETPVYGPRKPRKRLIDPFVRGHRRGGAFHDFEQGLLYALARDVAGDRWVVGLAGNLVDLVDIDDTTLGALDIVVGGLQQLEDDVLDVLADIAGFGERGRIRHREGHVEDARERLRQQRLARTGWADQQDVRLRELDVVMLGLVIETLVVIMDRDREHLLSVILADDIVVKNFAYLLGGRNAVTRLHQPRTCSPRG